MHAIPETGIAALLRRYRAFLLDAYGVLVHANGAMPGAAEFLRALERADKAWVVITNDASKLPETAAARYGRFGLPIPPDRIVTSGLLLREYFAEHALQGARCAVLGPHDSIRYVELSGGEVVAAALDFDVLVVGDETGFPFLETVDAAITSLYRRLDRGHDVHLVLPNPDIVFPRGEHSFGIAAGSVALLLEHALTLRYPERDDLRFVRLGKPDPALFEAALTRCGTRAAVMIGDTLETDIRGANACGIDSVLIATGVSAVHGKVAGSPAWPTYRLRSLLDRKPLAR